MIALLLKAWPYLAAIGVVFGLLFAAYHHGETVTGDQWQVKWDKQVQQQQAKVEQLQNQLQAAQARHQKQMAAVDAKYQEQIQHDKQMHDRDLVRLNSGALRLRKRFSCTAASHSAVSKASASASGGDAAQSGGLQKADAAFLVQLADRADQITHQLQACQATIKAIESSTQ